MLKSVRLYLQEYITNLYIAGAGEIDAAFRASNPQSIIARVQKGNQVARLNERGRQLRLISDDKEQVIRRNNPPMVDFKWRQTDIGNIKGKKI